MARFEISEAITQINEGGYADHPDDKGGETYAGIARNHWTNWEGWQKIDIIKRSLKLANKPVNALNINRECKKLPILNDYVLKFYEQNFWDVLKLDFIENQQLSNSIYDFGVNSGTVKAVKLIQQSVNNVHGTRLLVDGKMGVKTITEINKANSRRLYNEFNKLRKEFYISIAKGSQEQFLKSWLSRLKPYQ